MSSMDDIIKQWKSYPQKDVMKIIADSITVLGDISCMVLRTHLWAEGFMDGILFQVSKYSDDDNFAKKIEKLYELKLIEETTCNELKILNNIRNLVAHKLYPHKEIEEEVKKFPRFEQFKLPEMIDSPGLDLSKMSSFGLISFMLMNELMTVFWDPRIKS